MQRRIELHDKKTDRVISVNPDHIVLIEATEDEPPSPATITMITGQILRPRETYGEILDRIGELVRTAHGAY